MHMLVAGAMHQALTIPEELLFEYVKYAKCTRTTK